MSSSHLRAGSGFEVWLSAWNRRTAEYVISRIGSRTQAEVVLFHDLTNPDAVMEGVLTTTPDFDDPSSLAENIVQGVERFIATVSGWLKCI